MRHLTENDVKEMSQLEVHAVICEGLAEVATMLANEAEDKEQGDRLAGQAKEFESLAKVFHAVKNPRRAKFPEYLAPPEHRCECGRYFMTERGLKRHRSISHRQVEHRA